MRKHKALHTWSMHKENGRKHTKRKIKRKNDLYEKIENIWKSNSNNKSLQVNEVQCVFDWLNYAHRETETVNTCSFFRLQFLLIFFPLRHCHGCRFDFATIITQLKTISQTKRIAIRNAKKKSRTRTTVIWFGGQAGWLLVVS